MSNLAPFKTNQQPGLPVPPKGDTIARFGTYLEAQKAVDHLSDNHFPVQAVTIVGVDLKMVERVTGRLTYARVALAGLLSGAWFGLFVGLLLSLFGSSSEGQGISVFAAVFIGAAFGLLFGLISYAFTGGRRDFTSTSQIVAGEYLVLCLTEQAGKAMQLLNQLARDGGPSSNDPSGPSGLATAPVTPAPGESMPPMPVGTPAGPEPEKGAPPVTEPVTGPTYSEMIDRKKAEDRERQDRERAEAAERQQVEAAERAEQERRQAAEAAEQERRQAAEAAERARTEAAERAEQEKREAAEQAERARTEAAEREKVEAQAAPTQIQSPVQAPTVQVPILDDPPTKP